MSIIGRAIDSAATRIATPTVSLMSKYRVTAKLALDISDLTARAAQAIHFTSWQAGSALQRTADIAGFKNYYKLAQARGTKIGAEIEVISETGRIDRRFFWVNQPLQHKVENGRLHVTTAPDTDLWQGTHYGFRRDNVHSLLTKVTHDFSLTVRTEFDPQKQYDQCGLIVRGNSRNWIKVSTEYEDQRHSRLGSVVTNLGWSDWATTDVDSSVRSRWYRIQRRGQDFKIEYSDDGKLWTQLRISHLCRNFNSLSVGIYACSPNEKGSFEATFDHISLGNSSWA
ncbi:MAG: DUF1349 domain-containing protein [Candidatus Saganbacteria bacterium]|nr:DUF1349 domain-containing protein [Candidatus Saganbacteria bacterium]